MAQEVDQASVDVIKVLLESENGKEFFYEYLRHNLKLHLNEDGSRGLNVSIMFNSKHVTGSNIVIKLGY